MEAKATIKEVQGALNEWQCAINRFDYTVSQELIDVAIYDMEAAKRRFVCYLKQDEAEPA